MRNFGLDHVRTSECVLTCGVLNIGRKEITTFFYFYMALTMTSLILDAGVIPPGSGTFPYFVAVQNGFTSALCTCLLINGFVGFQLYEDGTKQSVWLLRGSSIGMFVISGAVSILTFKGRAGLGPTNTVGLFVVLYLINGICLLIYLVMQVILVTNTLQDRWPLGDISFGVFFFVIGQVILYVFSDTICNAVSHYLDGLFFATICNLLAVMMVYKVRLGGEKQGYRVTANMSSSTGIPLQRKILSSALVQSKAIGKSKSSFLKMTDGVPSITTVLPSMQAARTLSVIRNMAASSTEVHFISPAKAFEHGDGVMIDGWGMGWRPNHGQWAGGKNDDWQILSLANTMGTVFYSNAQEYANLNNNNSSRDTGRPVSFDSTRDLGPITAERDDFS